MPRHVVVLWRFIHQHFALAFLEHYARLQLFFTDRVNPSPWDASKECSWADRGKAPVKRRIRTIRRLWSLCPALHSRGNHDTPHAHFPPSEERCWLKHLDRRSSHHGSGCCGSAGCHDNVGGPLSPSDPPTWTRLNVWPDIFVKHLFQFVFGGRYSTIKEYIYIKVTDMHECRN